MVKCSNCQFNIKKEFCPNCGQKFTGERVTVSSIAQDFFSSFFLTDKSFFKNAVLLLNNPNKMVRDYWMGFRNYYYSPNKFLFLALILLGLNFYLFENKFLGISLNVENVSTQFLFVFLLIPVFTLSTRITYFKSGKNFAEHLVMNVYTFSLWLLAFSTLSMLVSSLETPFLEFPMLLGFVILVLFWNSRILVRPFFRQMLFVLINFLVFILIIALYLFLFYLLARSNPETEISLPDF